MALVEIIAELNEGTVPSQASPPDGTVPVNPDDPKLMSHCPLGGSPLNAGKTLAPIVIAVPPVPATGSPVQTPFLRRQ